jgi:hypothetical protein
MKILLLTLFLSLSAFANKGAIALRKPVELFSINTATSNVTSAAWRELTSASTYACSGLLIGNSGDKVLHLARGAAASEVSLGVAIQGGTAVLIPAEVSKSTRLSLKSLAGDQTSGVVHVSCLQ